MGGLNRNTVYRPRILFGGLDRNKVYRPRILYEDETTPSGWAYMQRTLRKH